MVTKSHQLKLKVQDGKYCITDTVDIEDMLRRKEPMEQVKLQVHK